MFKKNKNKNGTTNKSCSLWWLTEIKTLVSSYLKDHQCPSGCEQQKGIITGHTDLFIQMLKDLKKNILSPLLCNYPQISLIVGSFLKMREVQQQITAGSEKGTRQFSSVSNPSIQSKFT